MSTRSRIGIEDQETGKVRSIYCHSDGYLEGVGKTLVEHYTTGKKVKALIALGDLSALGEEIGEKHDFDYRHGFYEQYRGAGYDAMYADPAFMALHRQCLAYGRDRDDPNTRPAEDENAEAYAERATDGWEEFAYLYRQGVWFVREIGGGAGPFMGNANDPAGEAEKPWANVAGALRFGMGDHRSYAILGGPMGHETATARGA